MAGPTGRDVPRWGSVTSTCSSSGSVGSDAVWHLVCSGVGEGEAVAVAGAVCTCKTLFGGSMMDGGGVSLESIRPIASIAPPRSSVRSLRDAAVGREGESRLGERNGRGGFANGAEGASGVEEVLVIVGIEYSEDVREGLGLGLEVSVFTQYSRLRKASGNVSCGLTMDAGYFSEEVLGS